MDPLSVVVRLHQKWNSPLREPECSGKNFLQVREEKMVGQSTRYINTGFFRIPGLGSWPNENVCGMSQKHLDCNPDSAHVPLGSLKVSQGSQNGLCEAGGHSHLCLRPGLATCVRAQESVSRFHSSLCLLADSLDRQQVATEASQHRSSRSFPNTIHFPRNRKDFQIGPSDPGLERHTHLEGRKDNLLVE